MIKSYFLFLFTMTLASLSVEAQHDKKIKPNVIIIFADDMGYGDVSSLNPEALTSTPNIDKMARNGVVFNNTHASASVCTPSRYGILTGRYAWRSESAADVVNGFGMPVIEKGRKTIATLFKNSGYTTAAIGKWHLGLEWQTKDGKSEASFNPETGYSNIDYSKAVTSGPNDYGFDYSFISPASLDMPPYVFLRNHRVIDPEVVHTSSLYPQRLEDTKDSWDKKHTGDQDIYWGKGVWWRSGEISRSFRMEDCLPDIVEEGLSFIQQHVNEKPATPFFMYMPLTGPHTPWMPTKKFKGKSPVGTYGDFILTIDDVVGQVSETLKQLGIAENTIVIFTSDNGAYWPQSEVELQQHNPNWGTRGQKGDIWDGGHRIPLIISWPTMISKPLVYDHLLSLTDVYATIADMTEQTVPQNSGEDSFSFWHVLNGEVDKTTRTSMIHQSSGGLYGIRTSEWKYIDGLGSGGFTAPQRIKPEPDGPLGQLYSIKVDSLEAENDYLLYPVQVKRLRKELMKGID